MRRENNIAVKSKGRSRRRKILYWLLASFVLYLAFNFGQGFYQIQALKKEIAELEKEAVLLKETNLQLEEEIIYLESPEAVEKLAREKLGLIKEGEILIMKARGLVKE